MNLQKKIDDLIKETAKKYNKPYDVVFRAWASQFKLLRETMAKKENETVKLPNWGKYIVSKPKLAKLEEYFKSKGQTNYGEESNGAKDN